MVHRVFDYELTALQDASPSTHLTFFGVAFGTAVAFGSIVLSQSPSDKGHGTFVALFWASVVLAVYFGIRSYQATKANSKIVNEIRKRQV